MSSLQDQVQLMIDLVREELGRHAPPHPGVGNLTEYSLLSAKLGTLKRVMTLFEGERNRDREIWEHFLTILRARRVSYVDTEYGSGDHPYPEDVLGKLNNEFALYLKSHGIDISPLPEGDEED